jgi:invasion protein IalB
MPMTFKHLPVLALLAMAAPLAAQVTPEGPATPTEQPAGDTPAAAPTEAPSDAPAEAPAEDVAPDALPGTDTGAPSDAAAGEPQVGQLYEREKQGDWSIRCVRREDEVEPCDLYQLLLDQDGNAVAEFSIRPLAEGGEAVAGANIVAPLETLLTAGLVLSVDGAAERRYPFSFCNEGGCVARVGFTAEEVQGFRRGNAAQLSLVPAVAPDQTVTLTISLAGFTAGYEAVSQTPPIPSE